MAQKTLLKGRVLSFIGSPFDGEPTDATRLDEAVVIEDGRIADVGAVDALALAHPDAVTRDHGNHLIMAGFVDPHVHYPQTAMIASWGKRLIDWLNTYTFPEEMKFGDPVYASEIANRYLDLTTAHGTTTMCSFCTIHPESVDAFFTAAQQRGQRVVAGKTCMDRNAPEGLRDTAQTAYDQSAALLEKWHRIDRLSYAITPRFSPTSTPEQLEAMGALWAEHPHCLMQTHLSEQTDEIEWVQSLFPDARDYLDTYEKFGLLGQNGLYGHVIHLEDRERDRLREVDASLIHCPTSNTFIGSGLFDMSGLIHDGHRIGLATDTGGGSSFSMLRTMAAAYEIGQLRGRPLHPAQLLWLGTVGSARSLRMDDCIGNVAPGMEADLVVLDLASTPAIAQREAHANDVWEAVFPTIMMGDDRAVAEVWIGGQQAA
ncbi:MULTISPECIES: guanine deaminase [unclassified Ruegeria]|uniref:guanine deaminase n=1 Tax=unclassified Ruegeria TaxID=2625375 RepID=UPI001487F234|nr:MULTISPECIES: guanine deaminase [unclassified Ruegeria]NOD74650.1 guanine deaminase [Ruegeria sp. HKCCD4332]NOD88616.1 guanine deaminase [Ruegeria sp. HKCCD4318]NOE12156.1 guanine deaminase [Ruegeria sp. HKCCD4318-2]NOG09679.1 guanine deaminase [Ruegeria sp. HKCCD4315]